MILSLACLKIGIMGKLIAERKWDPSFWELQVGKLSCYVCDGLFRILGINGHKWVVIVSLVKTLEKKTPLHGMLHLDDHTLLWGICCYGVKLNIQFYDVKGRLYSLRNSLGWFDPLDPIKLKWWSNFNLKVQNPNFRIDILIL